MNVLCINQEVLKVEKITFLFLVDFLLLKQRIIAQVITKQKELFPQNTKIVNPRNKLKCYHKMLMLQKECIPLNTKKSNCSKVPCSQLLVFLQSFLFHLNPKFSSVDGQTDLLVNFM